MPGPGHVPPTEAAWMPPPHAIEIALALTLVLGFSE